MSATTVLAAPVVVGLPRQERRTLLTCQAFAGTLIVPCPNLASVAHSRDGAERMVCRGHQG